MPIVIKTEKATSELIKQMEDLSKAYYMPSTGVPEYDFNTDLFTTLDGLGQLVLVCAWDYGQLVGYTYFILSNHPHHKTWKLAFGGIAVDKQYRGNGIATRMYEDAEKQLKALGVSRALLCERVLLNADPLYPKLGFALEERAYKKDL